MQTKYLPICHKCSNAKRVDFRTVVCSISKDKIESHCLSGVCPIDKFKMLSLLTDTLENIVAFLNSSEGAEFPPNWHKSPNVQAAYRLLVQQYIPTIPEYPGGSGRGIVIAGGGTYFVSAMTVIKVLRWLGCNLPIELWGLPEELPKWQEDLVSPLGVTCIRWDEHASKFGTQNQIGKYKGWELKTYAIKHSGFEEVFYLDSDAIPQQNLEKMFGDVGYIETGMMAWPDLPGDPSGYGDDLLPEIWSILGLPDFREPSFETGQLLVNRKKWWQGVCLSNWLCQRGWDYYFKLKIWYGDKECPHVAAHLLGLTYVMPPFRPTTEKAIMLLPRDMEGKPLIGHRTQLKLWNNIHQYAIQEDIPLDRQTAEIFYDCQEQYFKAMPPKFIVGVTVAVNYVDYLEKTIHNQWLLNDWIIVTVANDPVIALCKKNAIKYVISDKLHLHESKFNLGALRNEGIAEAIKIYGQDIWCLYLDGDCKLPSDYKDKIYKADLEVDKIYGAKRKGDGSEKYDEGVSGFFQLFHSSHFPQRQYIETFENAGRSDVHFRDLWTHRRVLDITLEHLGTTGVDWNGRSPINKSNILHGAAGLAKAALGLGGATEEMIANRMGVCDRCPNQVYTIGIIKGCKICGCVLPAKVRNKDEKCPIDKW